MELIPASSSVGTSSDPQVALHGALRDFQSILTDGERGRLGKLGSVRGADTVMIFTLQLDRENQLRKGRAIAGKVYSVLQCVQAFSTVVETFVSSHPDVAALVWGSIKLTMLLAVNYTSYFETISAIFMAFSKQCPRFSEYQALYPTSARLRKALCDFNASIIHCCKHVIEVIRRPWTQQLQNALFQSLEKEFQPFVQDIQKLGKEVKDEVASATALANYQDQKLQAIERKAASKNRSRLRAFVPTVENDLDEIKEMSRQQSTRRSREEKQRLLDWLSSHDYRRPFSEACKKRHCGTAEWICEAPEFIHWRTGTGPPLLWCSGKIGSGKTILCANVINHVFLTKNRNTRVSFFFVDRDNTDSLRAETMIRSIIRQSLDFEAEPAYVEKQLRTLERAPFVTPETWVNLLRHVVQQSTVHFILIDGLDECDAAERRNLLDALSSITATTSHLRTFIASRASVSIDLRSRPLPMEHISMAGDRLASDIRAYIDASIQERVQNEELVFGDPHLIIEVNDTLTQHADGIAKADVNAAAAKQYGRTALQAACEGGHLEVVERLLHAKADVNAPAAEYNGRTALQAACEKGHLEVVERLLSAKAYVNAAATKAVGRTALQAACEGGHLEVVERLLGAKADVNAAATDFTARTALQAACAGGHLEVVERLLSAEADVNAAAANFSGRTALQAACEKGHLEVVERLLGAKADVNAAAANSSGRTALQAACEKGHLEVVERLLGAKADVNAAAANSSGRTALQAACEKGHLEVVERLLGAKADVNASAAEYTGRTALQAACGGGHLEVVERLLGAKADINAAGATKSSGRTALQAACGGGHLEVVERLLGAKADVNAAAATKSSGRTALQAACEGGHLEVVERLLSAKADVNAAAANSSGRTALQAACEGGHLEVVERLLGAKADVNAAAANFSGRTALQAACEKGHLEVVERLLGAKADVNAFAATKSSGRTALQAACEGGHLEVVERLLSAKADVNASAAEYTGRTALQLACGGGHLEVVERLLGAKADVNAAATKVVGRTALQAACEGGHLEVVERLLGAEAYVNAADSSGRTALRAACEGGHLEVVERLLGAKADVNAATQLYGRTALQAAGEGGFLEIVELLVKAGAKT
ncbi:hypothetical protein V2A60_008753 [Cordyceps javanica]